MVNQERVKELLLALSEEIQQVKDEEERMDAETAIETLTEILQMN